MKIACSVLTLSVIVSQVACSPLPYSKRSKSDNKEKVLYDQRQEGEWNIRADLKNFVILIIPKTPEPQEEPSGGNLLDLFTRSHSKHYKHAKNSHKATGIDTNEVGAETMHFIESKTAPYHVDITKSSSHLMNDEILATQTPPAASALKIAGEKSKEESSDVTSKTSLLRQLRSTRFAKAFVLTVPEEEIVLTKMNDDKIGLRENSVKKENDYNKQEMTLLGANEQCGPDMTRDVEGICRMKTNDYSTEGNEPSEREE